MPDLVVVKLGGSLITDKSADSALRPGVLGRLCRELAAGREQLEESLVVAHGSGSFGHVAAQAHGYAEGSALSPKGVSDIQSAAHRLHGLVTEALNAAGLECYSIVPGSSLVSRVPGELELFEKPLRLALELGLVPVMCGDIVLDARLRGIIVSTEALLSALTNQLDPSWFRVRRVLWLGETEGVLDAEGNTVARVEAHNIEEVLTAIGGAAGTDVTGGMRLRVETAWELAGRGVESRVLNGARAGCLASALAGGDAGGTVVVPHAPTPS